MNFKDKNFILGVSGGIAAYKSVELLRMLKKAGGNVNVIMTESARNFVGRTTFEVLSENSVLSDLFSESENSIKHIDLATGADAVIIAPATANIIAKLAHGIADDALTTTMLAVKSPVMICPAMNTNMYENIKVQTNLDILERDGWHIVDPDSGALACKTVGAGRLPDPWLIFDRIEAMLNKKDLKGKKILLSAGPTVEAIDPVRFISNHSSGKMGYAIARAAEKRGAQVTLVSGPVNLVPPVGIEVIDVVSCNEMAEQMILNLEDADIIIKVAAVSDYRPVDPSERKIKKKDNKHGITITMVENRDILKLIGEKKRDEQFLVGFAAETNDLEENALKKIKKKKP